MKTKEFNINILYLFIGIVFGILLSLTTLKFASASSDINFSETILDLENRGDFKYFCLYDTETKEYKLFEYEDENAYFTDETYFVNGGYMENIYIWTGSEWYPIEYGVFEYYTPKSTEKLIYSSVDLLDENGNVYFYKSNSIITNEVWHGISTIQQNVLKTIQTLIPIIILIISSYLVIKIIPRVFKRFF